MKVVKLLFGLAVAVIIVGVISNLMKPKPAAGRCPECRAASTSEIAQAGELPLPVRAEALFRAYDDNEVAADQKYKGKSLLVSGTVQSIDKDFTDGIVVKLGAGNPFMPVHAYLDKEHEAVAASLKKGAKVAWVCTGGGRIIGSPVLRKCAAKV